MKLWKITAPEWLGHDTFGGAIVAAPSEEEARAIHPESSPGELLIYPDAGRGKTWDWRYRSWVEHPSEVIVELIGEAEPDTPKGVILASFHAG